MINEILEIEDILPGQPSNSLGVGTADSFGYSAKGRRITEVDLNDPIQE
jgi:hypothetical protein